MGLRKWLRSLYWRTVGHRLWWRKFRRSPEYLAAASTGKISEIYKVVYPQRAIDEVVFYDHPMFFALNDKGNPSE